MFNRRRPPEFGGVRRAKVEDAPRILDLLGESISLNFRVTCTNDIVSLIESSVLSICQLDTKNEIVGFLAAKDYPLLPSVDPYAWEEYVWTKYKLHEMNARNTLFIHLLCWNTEFNRELVDNMLKSIFMHDPYVTYIAMIKCLLYNQVLIPGQSRSEGSFRRVTAIERGMRGDMLPALYVAERSEVSPRLRIRRAVEEDNDDIIPILEQHSDRLRKLYGEFYISELISRHPESERILLVCEHKELAVGVMCLNTQINYEALEENFELFPFAGLRHMDETPPEEGREREDIESTNSSLHPEALEPETLEPEKSEPVRTGPRVTWVFEDDEFNKFRNGEVTPEKPAVRLSEELPMLQRGILDLFDEEEEFEFDIVNIDTDLLRVPEMIGYDDDLYGPSESILKVIAEGSESDHDKTAEKPKRTTNASAYTTSFQLPEPRRYTGTPNAFLLELYAIHNEYDDRYGFDMLEVAFEMFPDRDYCVMCVPTNHIPFPLLEHFTLVTSYGCKMRFINDALYVAHVNSVRGKVSVRPGEASDMIPLQQILDQAPQKENLMDLFQSTLTSHRLQSFTLLSQNQPVGVVVLGPLEDGTAVRTQYDLDPEARPPGSDGTILAGVMSPAFGPHARWFMRDILRQSRYSAFFYMCRLFARRESNPIRNLMSLAGHMTPVHPHQSLPNISRVKDLEKIYNKDLTPFALWVLERPLTSLPKVFMNNSIVIVGASRTGLAFLEALLMGPASQYLTFSNLTLVSTHGLPTVTDCLKAAGTCVPREGRYTDRYLKSLPFYYYLDVMTAVMIKIDRKRKCIHLKGGGIKYYDELVLACGEQFQHPDYLKESLAIAKEVAKGKPCDRILLDNPKYKPETVPMSSDLPENVFLINSLFEANICLKKLMCMISEHKPFIEPLSEQNPVIVYGDCIEAYSCIAALLELGLSPQMIIFVEPFPSVEEPAPLRVNCFNDETVDAKVQATVEGLGIRVIRQFFLAAWHQVGNRVEALEFMGPLTASAVRIFALFYYGLRAINLHAFKAINESGLVYDGGLVVNPTFQTNDPSIYGAGTCVRYSRRLYANKYLHRNYYSEDIGEAMARLFLYKLDPFMARNKTMGQPTDLIPKFDSSIAINKQNGSLLSYMSEISVTSEFRRWEPVLKFDSPIVQFAVLPGPVFYLKIRKPGREVPMAIQQCLPRQGHYLVTNKNDNYFCLHLNVLHVVDGVTCLSHDPFSSEILQQLYGKHEAFFNQLFTRYQMNLIDDFYEFFTQPWMSILYQESFRDLIDDINEQDIGTIHDLVKSKFAFFDAELNKMKSTLMKDTAAISGGAYPMDSRRKGTFRSMIGKFVSKVVFNEACDTNTCIPSECGQSREVRQEAARFWKKAGGERVVLAHVARYLDRYAVINPHYAVPSPEIIEEQRLD